MTISFLYAFFCLQLFVINFGIRTCIMKMSNVYIVRLGEHLVKWKKSHSFYLMCVCAYVKCMDMHVNLWWHPQMPCPSHAFLEINHRSVETRLMKRSLFGSKHKALWIWNMWMTDTGWHFHFGNMAIARQVRVTHVRVMADILFQ